MGDEIVRLVLDVDRAPVTAAVPAVRELKAETYDLADGVKEAAHALDTYALTTVEVARKARDQTAAIHEEVEAYELVGDAFDQMVSEVVADAGRLEVATARTGANIRRAGAAAEESVSMLSGRMAMGFNQLAQGMEDLQYSVGGAMNNLGSAVMMFGGPMGLVAGATLAGIAINQIAKHWDELQEAFRDAPKTLSTFSESISHDLDKLAEKAGVSRHAMELFLAAIGPVGAGVALASVHEGLDDTITKLNEMAKAADEAREKVVELATAQGVAGAGAAKSKGDIEAGKVFGEAIKGALKPGQVGEDAIRAMSNLIGQQVGGDPAAMMATVRERFGRAMSGSQADMAFLRDYGRTAERGTLPRELADAITKGMADAAEKERVKSLSPEQKKAEEVVGKLGRALDTSSAAFHDVFASDFARAKSSEQAAIREAAQRSPLVASTLQQEEFKAGREAEKKGWREEAKDAEKESKDAAKEAEKEAEKEAKEAERARENDERAKQAAADERLRERDRMAQQALRDPRIRAEVEAAFARGGTTEQIAPQVGQFLAQQGMAPGSEAPFVGGEVTGEVRKDLNRRQAGYIAEGMDKMEAFARVQGEILAEFARMDQKLMQMDQSLMRQQGIMQGHHQTRLNRGEGF